MSAKNELQEYLQRENLPFVEYRTYSIGDEQHKLLWISETLFQGVLYEGLPCSKKKDAEKNVASLILKKINGEKISCHEFHFRDDKAVAILVDFENKPNFVKEFLDSVKTSGVHLYAFISRSHHMKSKICQLEAKNERLHVQEIQSSLRDAADVGLLICLGGLAWQGIYQSYIIVSGDHFAATAVEILQTYNICGSYTTDINACVCGTVEQAIETLAGLEADC